MTTSPANPIDCRALACGATLLVEPMASVASVAMSWLLPTGNAGDPADRLGEAAMLSELALRGAGELDSRTFSDALDRLGVQRSLSNGGRHLRLGATMLGSRLDDAAPLLCDLVRRPRLPEEALEAVRSLSLQSLESLQDEPQRRAMIALGEQHLPSPFNRSGLGSRAGLEAISIEHLRGRWHREVRPGGSIIAVAGRVDPAALASRLDALLEGWEGEAVQPEVDAAAAKGAVHLEQDSAQVHFGMALDAPPLRDPDSMAWALAVRILGGGSSSRLFVELRERRGLCYSVGAGADLGRDRGMVSIYAGSTPERIDESRSLILEGLASLAAGFTEAEFRRASMALRRSLVAQSESTTSRAVQLASDYDRLGRARTLAEIAESASRIDLARLEAFAASHLDEAWIEARSEVRLGPPRS